MIRRVPIAITAVPDDGEKRPFWSVMIPTYNPQKIYLEQTLRSVLEQNFSSNQMQIEVVDDCSPSVDVAALVLEIAGNRVNFFRSTINQGLAGSWNTCIERAHGEWVHILHQDDLVFPDFYHSLQNGIEKNPQVGAAYCRHSYCDENGHWHRLSFLESPIPVVQSRFVDALVTAERIQCAAIVVRRSTYEQLGGFNATLSHTLDWEMWIRIVNKFPIYYEPKILACWRNHSESTTSDQIRSGENIRDHIMAINIWSDYLPESESRILSSFALNRFAKEALLMARHLLWKNDFEGCLNQVRAALLCKCTFRLQISAFTVLCRASIKRILNQIKRG